ncbi:MAG: SDR family NAD(P)-dependent oxidoreductase [Phycisphaerales bacterium]
MPDITGRTIAITGASSGIGAATARAAAAAGMDVVLVARRTERLEAVAADVRAAGRTAVCVAADVNDPASDAAILSAAAETGTPLHAVFANAGYGLDADLLDCSDAQIRDIFETNVFAADRLLRASARHLLDAGRGGHLLSCCSCVSRFSLPGSAAYAATKAAQAHLATGLRIELHGTGVTVSSVHPVTTRTEFFDVAAERGGKTENRLLSNAAARFSQPPERVASAVVRCLRRPRPEVWTSLTTRTGAALMVLSPRLGDFILRRAQPR